jgi:membrane protease YdiL (CAAX protease family)
VSLLILASPLPEAVGAWLDVGLGSGLALALPLGLSGPLILRFGLLRRFGDALPEPREPGRRGLLESLLAALFLLAVALLPPSLAGAFRPAASGYRMFAPAAGLPDAGAALSTLSFFGLQSLVEELLFRAFLFTVLALALLFLARLLFGRIPPDDEGLQRRRARRWLVAGLLADAGQAAGFALLHARNPNVTPLGLVNIGLAGAVLGWLFWSRASLLGCWAFHTLWNSVLAALALPVSGMTMGTPVFATGILGAGLVSLSGGTFGPEGSFVTTAGLTALLVILVRRSARALARRYPSTS